MGRRSISKTTQLFTTGQVAKFCDVSIVTVWRWIQDEKLKAETTPGGHHRVRRKDLLNLLASHEMVVPKELKK